MILTRRQTLLSAAAALLPVPAIAAPEYRLELRQVADGVWLVEGAQDSIARSNGGAKPAHDILAFVKRFRRRTRETPWSHDGGSAVHDRHSGC